MGRGNPKPSSASTSVTSSRLTETLPAPARGPFHFGRARGLNLVITFSIWSYVGFGSPPEYLKLFSTACFPSP